MVVVPAPIAFTVPLVTVATDLSDESQTIPSVLALDGTSVAFKVRCSPTSIPMDVKFKETLSGSGILFEI